MKKIVLFSVMFFIATAMARSEVITLDDPEWASLTLTDISAEQKVTIQGVTFSWYGTICDTEYNGVINRDLRVYAGKSLTISYERPIAKIEVIGAANKGANISSSSGIVTGGNYTEATEMIYKYENGFNEPLFVIDNINSKEIVIKPIKQIRVYGIRITTGFFDTNKLHYEFLGGDSVVVAGGDKNTESIIIPETVTFLDKTYRVTSIAESVFEGCTALISVTIPKSITSIGNAAFNGCTSLTSVIWNASQYPDISSLNAPFYKLRSQITSFIFGDSVKHIPAYLCSGMSKLTSVTIPKSVASIGEQAFYGCSGLTKTNYMGNVASWCAFKFDNYRANPIYYSHNFYINNVEIKDLIIPENTKVIGNHVFDGCTGFTSVIISNDVDTIGSSAFYGCSNITSLSIGQDVSAIGNKAFYGCTSLTSVVWNAEHFADFTNNETPFYFYSSSSSSSNHFDLRSQMISFIFGDNVKHIPANLCNGMSNLTTVTLPNNLISIGSDAFYNTPNIKYNKWGNAYYLGNDENLYVALIKPTNTELTVCTLCPRAKVIATKAFSGCNKLTTLTIPESFVSINDSAFDGCTLLESLNVPKNIVYLGNNIFSNCNRLRTLNYDAVQCKNGAKAFSANYLRTVNMGKSVKSLPKDLFNGCSQLQTTNFVGNLADWCQIEFDTLTSNPTYYSKGLQIDSIPQIDLLFEDSVSYISNYAFAGCANIETIISRAIVPPLFFEGTFTSVSREIPVFVPEASLEDYQFDPNWSEFAYLQAEPNFTYSYSATSANDEEGSVNIIQEPTAIRPILKIEAVAKECYLFDQWSDGNKENPRTIEMTSDTVLTATFKNAFTYIFSAISENPKYGEVEIKQQPTCQNNAIAIVEAKPNKGYKFAYWNDGSTENPYTMQVTENVEYMAIFEVEDAEEDVDDVVIVPTDETAAFAWSAIDGAATYTLIIWANAEQTERVCTITFDAEGRVTNIDFSKSTQPRNNASSAGFSFTVTGLNSGTTYQYEITAKNSDGVVIDTKSGEFTTTGETETALPKVEILENLYSENGTIYGAKNLHIFTVTGIDVTEMNGNLHGVYIVKANGKVGKIVVK